MATYLHNIPKKQFVEANFTVEDGVWLALVTTKHSITGRQTTTKMDMLPRELQKWQDGELIQNAFPRLSESEREMLLSGMTSAEFDAMFADSQ
jgi:hypothetical protein